MGFAKILKGGSSSDVAKERMRKERERAETRKREPPGVEKR